MGSDLLWAAELVKRLRASADHHWPRAQMLSNTNRPESDNDFGRICTLQREAADTIESLRASLTRAQYTCEAHASEVLKGGECVWCTLKRVEEEREEAVKALEPFARVGEVFEKTSDDQLVPWGTPDGTRVDLFRASAVTRDFITAGQMRKAHEVHTRLSRASPTETE